MEGNMTDRIGSQEEKARKDVARSPFLAGQEGLGSMPVTMGPGIIHLAGSELLVGDGANPRACSLETLVRNARGVRHEPVSSYPHLG